MTESLPMSEFSRVSKTFVGLLLHVRVTLGNLYTDVLMTSLPPPSVRDLLVERIVKTETTTDK